MKTVSRYEVIRELGRGGMGVVYLARDPLLDREVAVKLIGSLSDDRKQRFIREARVIAKMEHPGIVGVHDLGELEDGLFFVMPYVPGTNLRLVLNESPLRLRQLVELGIQAAEALDYSHGLGIVHRDVKPENIMVPQHTADALRIRITDFGLAIHATEQRLTTTGALVGTVSYLSPEQVMGGTIDSRVDIYALGTVLYECIAGRTPFKGEIQSVLFRIVHEEPQPLKALVQDIDPELEALVLSCLQKDPALRPQRASDIAAALGRYRGKIANTARAGEAMRTIEIRGMGAPLPAAPFVGRARELAELQTRLNAAVGGESQLVLIDGEAGVGKTRLVEELERLAHARQIRVMAGNFNEQDGALPFQGFCEMFETHMRRVSASSTELAELEDDLVALFPSLGELRAVRSRSAVTHRAQPAGGEHDRIAVFDVLARTLTRIAADESLMIILEDLHLATVSVEALQYITRRLGPTRTLLVGTYITSEVDKAHPITKLVDGFKGNRRFATIHLDPFTPEEHRSFLATISLGATIDDTLSQRLYDASEGNPFFSRELFRSLIDTGNITREGHGSYVLAGGPNLAFDAVPTTVQKAVERRLERLPDDLRKLLSLASVLGKSFEEHELETLAEEEEDVDLDTGLDKLVRGGFLEEQRKARGERLEFTSGTMREVLYAELPRRKRRTMHKRLAQHLEQKNAGKLDRVRAQLVHHYAQADVADKVITHGLELARSALATFSADDAIRATKSVLGFIEEDQPDSVEAEARSLLARAYRMGGDFDGALKELEATIKMHESRDDAPGALAGYVEAAFTAWAGRRVAETKRWIDKGIKGVRAVGDLALLARLLPLGITVANLRGDTATARELLEESERLKRSETAEPEPTSAGGAVHVALGAAVGESEPATAYTHETAEVLANAFETLLTTDELGNVAPRLADLWESHFEGRRFTFTLRSGVTWHDGTKLTAADVKASLERAARLGKKQPALAVSAIRGARELWEGRADELSGIEVTGELTFAITLDEALPIFPSLLTDQRTAIARDGSPLPVGTGPFRLASHDPEHVVLSRHDGHWRDRPSIESLEYHAGLASVAIGAGLRAGRYDLTADLPPNEVEELIRDRRLGPKSVERPKKNIWFVQLRTELHEALRAALCATVATKDLVWRHVGRLGRPAEGLIPPGILGHDAGRRRPLLTREAGLELVARTNLPSPIVLRAAVHPVALDRHASAVQALFESWAALGVTVKNVTTDLASFLAQVHAPDAVDFMIMRWGADYDDPDSFATSLFDSHAGLCRAWHANPALDATIKAARLEPVPQRRAAMYRALEESLLAVHVILPLWHDEDCRVYGPRVRNVALGSIAPYIDFAQIRTAEAGARPITGGGSIAVALDVGISELDPSLISTSEDSNVHASVFETLTREISGARIVPWLARSFTVEDHGKRYRFVLRDNVRFHDGRPFTARDVRYSYERLLCSKSSYYPQHLLPIVGAREVIDGTRRELAGITIHSPHELTIDLSAPLPSFPALISYDGMAIIPEGSNPQGRTSYRDGCVGTGPFRVTRHEASRSLELEANPFYWRTGFPRSAGLSFAFNVPPADAVAWLRAGRTQLVANPNPAVAERLWSDPVFATSVRAIPTLSTYLLLLNSQRGPFSDPKVRRAIARGLDIDGLARSLGRVVTPARSLLPPGLLGHDAGRSTPSRSEPSMHLDLDVSLLVAPVFGARYERYAAALVEALARLGVRVKRSAGVIVSGSAEEYDVYLGRWVGDYPDPDTFMGILHSRAGYYGPFLGSPVLDRCIERIRTETDPLVRDATCRDAEAVIAEQSLLVPLFHDRYVLFPHPRVRGVTDDVLTSAGVVDFAALSVDD